MTRTTGQRATAQPYRIFTVQVGRVQRLSPTFLRLTMTGPDLNEFADNGFDQRIKLFFPLPGSGFAHLPTGPDWYTRWRELPDEHRNPVRTFTVRAARPEQREVDVDFVLHEVGDGHGAGDAGGGGEGPGVTWVRGARPGDSVALLGPVAGNAAQSFGVEFQPPARTGAVLLAGDETAVPAIAAILERLPAGTRGEALLEVPETADVLSVQGPPGMRIRWLARDGAELGSRLIPAVRAAAARLLPTAPEGPTDGKVLDDIDVDQQLLWEVPNGPHGTAGHDSHDSHDSHEGAGGTAEAAEAAAGDLYAWLAGEAGVIKTLRRHLVTERGLDRRSVAFMGYWRHGRPELGS